MTIDTLRAGLPDSVTTLIFPDVADGPQPEWAEFWANGDAGVVIVRHDDPHHALPAVRAFETAQLIFANPGAVAIGDGLGADVLLRVMATWPHLPLSAVLLIDPAGPSRHTDQVGIGQLPDSPLPVPAILYLTRPATRRDRALAARWDCLLAEAGAQAEAAPTDHLPRLKALRDQLARLRATPSADLPDRSAAPGAGTTPASPPALPKRGLSTRSPLPRILV